MKIIFIFILVSTIFYSFVSKSKKKDQSLTITISINSKDSTIRINNQILPNYNLSTINKIFGKPDRTEEHSFDSYIEEFPLHKGESPTTYPVKVKNFYYIYDKLGIVFYTQNGEVAIKEPTRCNVYFKNKRSFTNTNDLPFKPKTNFTGIFCINGDTINTNKNLVPENVNYKTNKFDLFHILFAPTSYTAIIDSIYCYESRPYMQFFLDGEKTQRISYIMMF